MKDGARLVAPLAALALIGSPLVSPAFGRQERSALSSSQAVSAPLSPDSTIAIILSQHRRLTFPQDIQRIAVGEPQIVGAELITSREVLALGRRTGRTTLIVWF